MPDAIENGIGALFALALEAIPLDITPKNSDIKNLRIKIPTPP
jgi:hypothetical protein